MALTEEQKKNLAYFSYRLGNPTKEERVDGKKYPMWHRLRYRYYEIKAKNGYYPVRKTRTWYKVFETVGRKLQWP